MFKYLKINKSIITSTKEYVNEDKLSILKWIFLLYSIYLMYCTIQIYFINVFDFIFHDLQNEDRIYSRSIFVLLFSSLLIIRLAKKCFDNNLLPNLMSIIRFTLCLLLYFFLFRKDDEIYYYRLFWFENIYLSDIIVISLLIVVQDYRHYGKQLTGNGRYIFNDNKTGDTIDLYKRKIVANRVANVINNSLNDSSINISIAGDWGYGKTVFINYIKKNLDDSQCICIDFNPWITPANVSITEMFFDSIKSSLSRYNSDLSKRIGEYSQSIWRESSEENHISRIVKLIMGIFISDINKKSILEQKREINQSIIRIRKKIVVFVDDLDRLTSKEILDVFGLIRNTADFNNTFFVVSLDKKYVREILDKDMGTGYSSKYLEKIFQLEFPLPPIPALSVKNTLIDGFNKRFKADDNNLSEELSMCIDSLCASPVVIRNGQYFVNKNILEHCLVNVRDVNRFLNVFILSYEMSKDANIYDLLLLNLLKYKFSDIYDSISKMKLIEIDINKNLTWKIIESGSDIKDEIYNVILSLMFPDSSTPTNIRVINYLFGAQRTNHIRYIENFELYFNYLPKDISSIIINDILDNRIKFQEYLSSKILNKSPEEILYNLSDIYEIAFYESKNLTRLNNIIRSLEVTSKYFDYKLTESLSSWLLDKNNTKSPFKKESFGLIITLNWVLSNKNIDILFKGRLLSSCVNFNLTGHSLISANTSEKYFIKFVEYLCSSRNNKKFNYLIFQKFIHYIKNLNDDIFNKPVDLIISYLANNESIILENFFEDKGETFFISTFFGTLSSKAAQGGDPRSNMIELLLKFHPSDCINSLVSLLETTVNYGFYNSKSVKAIGCFSAYFENIENME